MEKVVASIVGAVLALVLFVVVAATIALSAVVPGQNSGPADGLGGGPGDRPSSDAATDIPPAYLTLYQQAATTCPGLSWTVLAGIGKVESDHGRSRLPGVRSGSNYAGAAVISRSLLAVRHVRVVGDTPRAGDVSAGCEA